LLALSLAILFGTLVVHFGLQPMMAALREAAGSGGVMESAQKARFGMLHGISSIIFMVQSVLAGVLVWKMR
jgi:peptide subunit release factor RF-3